MKIFFNTIGWIALALGVIGIALPLLPTTPFLLLAAACFMRGSDRMYRWLTQNRVFGRYLRDYQEQRGVTLRVKVVALTVMWASLLYSMYTLPALRWPLGLIGLGVSAYLTFRLKTLQKSSTCNPGRLNDKDRN